MDSFLHFAFSTDNIFWKAFKSGYTEILGLRINLQLQIIPLTVHPLSGCTHLFHQDPVGILDSGFWIMVREVILTLVS